MIEYWWIYTLFAVIYVYYKYISRNVNFWKNRGIDGPTPMPLFGNALDNVKIPVTELELQRSEKYGKVYGVLEFTQPVLTISDVELVKLVTMKDFNCFTNHQSLAPGDPLLSKMIVNLTGDDWKRVRNIYTPVFTTSKIRQMFPLVNKCVKSAMDYFDEMAAKQQPIDLQKVFASYAMDVIAHTVFGVEVNSFKDPDGEYARHASNLFPSASLRVMLILLMPNTIRKLFGLSAFSPEVVAYFKKLLTHIISERRIKQSNHKDLLQILLSAEVNDMKSLSKLNDEGFGNTEILDVKGGKRKLDDSEILAQSLNMVIAGTETTSMTLMYCAFKLATRPDIQSRLYSEVKDYFDSGKDDFDSLSSLPYLEAVLNETLRRYGPMVQFDRVANYDYNLGDTGITIPKGTVVNLAFHSIQHDPDYWPEPFEFRPERFLPENKSQIVPYSFAAFGYGPRICLGMKLAMVEMKAVISNLVYRFELLRTDQTPTEPIYNGKKITNHCEPIFVLLKRRNV